MPGLYITWKKSGIGRPKNQCRVLAGLGLKKLNQRVHLLDTPAIRGMANKVSHLVEIEETPEEPEKKPRYRRAKRTVES